MTNIPTDLLRTFTTVVDLRSFTRASQTLGVTQPAVSTQIKRLQALIGAELFDKSAPGVMLTAKGEAVAAHARRMLSINDQILDLSANSGAVNRVRIGIPPHHRKSTIFRLVAEFRAQHPEMRLQVCSEPNDTLMREFRRGEFDMVLGAADEQPAPPRWSWVESFAWAGNPDVLASEGPIPLAVIGEGSLARRLAVKALEEEGESYEIAYLGKSFIGVAEAVRAGLAVACWAREGLVGAGLNVVDQTDRLPRLADVTCGIFLAAGHQGSDVEELGGKIAEAIRTGGLTRF
jgi:DNA-binding transcriptional LysR family regulator